MIWATMDFELPFVGDAVQMGMPPSPRRRMIIPASICGELINLRHNLADGT